MTKQELMAKYKLTSEQVDRLERRLFGHGLELTGFFPSIWINRVEEAVCQIKK